MPSQFSVFLAQLLWVLFFSLGGAEVCWPKTFLWDILIGRNQGLSEEIILFPKIWLRVLKVLSYWPILYGNRLIPLRNSWSDVREIQTCRNRLRVDGLGSSLMLSLIGSNTPSFLTERVCHVLGGHLLNLYFQKLGKSLTP